MAAVEGPPPSREGRESQHAWNDDDTSRALEEDIREGNFWTQYKALLIRNVTIKIRERRKSLTELLMPLYWIMILAIIRITTGTTSYNEILDPQGSASLLGVGAAGLNGTILHVAPNNSQVREIIKEINQLTSFIEMDSQYYDTEKDLLEAFDKDRTMRVAVVFSEDLSSNISYTIRFNSLYLPLPSTESRWTPESQCREPHPYFGLSVQGCSPNLYYFSGFSTLQLLIDTAIIRIKTNKVSVPGVSVPAVTLQLFPKDGYTSDSTYVLRSIVPLYMVFAWAQFIVYLMMLVVEEKEKKIKEGMKMMGLRDSVYQLSWFTVYALYVVTLAVICIVVLPLARVFVNANLFLLFILFILYGFSSIVFALMLTPFFNNAKVAGVVGNLLQVGMSLLYYLQVFLAEDMSQGAFWALGFLSPCAFSLALDKVILFDSTGIGLSYDTIWNGPGLPFAGSLIMISVDIVLYLFLAFYLDNVVPSEFGTKRKPWFIFEKAFWVQQRKKYQLSGKVAHENFSFDSDALPTNPDVEPVSDELKGKVAVRIRNLKKTFHPKGKEPVHAVDGISLDVYEGQITAILGHNGAGKTTLFDMLTGMKAPTSGTASIFGLNIGDPNDLMEIRRITGVCPQHDIIFMTLTPREHLSFYARIRVPRTRCADLTQQPTRFAWRQQGVAPHICSCS